MRVSIIIMHQDNFNQLQEFIPLSSSLIVMIIPCACLLYAVAFVSTCVLVSCVMMPVIL